MLKRFWVTFLICFCLIFSAFGCSIFQEERESVFQSEVSNDMTIVNFGDSIFGNFKGETSISGVISKETSSTVYNCGFGGCEMSKRSNVYWNEFSMYKLADAIASGDFSNQERVANSGVSGMPSYFIDTVEMLKEIDFTKIDIITIAYGLNDFTSEEHEVENENNLYDVTTLGGALRYSIKKIGQAYPNLRIVVIPPIFRVWFDDDTGEMLYTSDTHEINGYKLTDFYNKCVEVAREFHLPYVDAYNELGINEYNYSLIYENKDGAHPNQFGREIYGKLIAKTIEYM